MAQDPFGFQNPWEHLGRGLGEAARQIGSFFAQRAQQQYQEGVAAIARGKERLQRIFDVTSDPDAVITPDQEAFYNEERAFWEKVVAARPMDAAEMERTREPTQLRNERQVTSFIQGQAARTAQSQGAPGAVQPSQVRAQTTETTFTTPSLESVLAQTARSAGLAEREYNRRIQLEDYQIALDSALAVQDDDQEFQTQRDAILEKYGISRTQLESDLRIREEKVRSEVGLRGQLTVMQFADLGERAAQLHAVVSDTTQTDSVRDAHAAQLMAIAQAQPLLGYTTEMIQQARGATDELAFQAAREGLTAALEEARAAQETARATGRTVGRIQELTVEGMERQLELLGTEIRINEGIVTLNKAIRTGQELDNARQEFANQRERVLAGQQDITTHTQYFQQAVEQGNIEAINELLNLLDNPDPNNPLTAYAQRIGRAGLESGLGIASEIRDLDYLNLDLVKEQAVRALTAEDFGSISDRLDFIQNIASRLSPEQIQEFRNSPLVQTLIAEGKISSVELDAAESRAEVREAAEQIELLSPKVAQWNTELERLASGRPDDVGLAEASLRAILGDMVKAEYLHPGAVDGIVSAYRQAWSDQGSILDSELALNQAQMDLWSSQAALYDTQASDVERRGAAGGVNLDVIEQARRLIDSRVELVAGEFPACFDEDGALFADQAGCSEAANRLAVLDSQLGALGDMMGIAGDSNAALRSRVIATLERINTGRATNTELAWLETVAARYGGDAGMRAMLGLAPSDAPPEEAPPEEDTPRPEREPRSSGPVGDAITGAAEAAAQGTAGAARWFGQRLGQVIQDPIGTINDIRTPPSSDMSLEELGITRDQLIADLDTLRQLNADPLNNTNRNRARDILERYGYEYTDRHRGLMAPSPGEALRILRRRFEVE